MSKLDKINEMIERNKKESQFKVLAAKVSKFWKYNDEDKRDLWEMYKADKDGVIDALKMQADNIDNMLKLDKSLRRDDPYQDYDNLPF